MGRVEPPAVSCCSVWVRVRRSGIRLVGGLVGLEVGEGEGGGGCGGLGNRGGG